MRIEVTPSNGGREEFGGKSDERQHQSGDVKFIRAPDGKILVSGNPNPFHVAKAITRAKQKQEVSRRAIGPADAELIRRRMRAELKARGA